MKKICTLMMAFMCVFCISINANAGDVTGYVPHKIIVEFQDDFSSKAPAKNFSVVLTKDCTVPNTRDVSKGTILYMEVTKISKEKVGKIDASVMARIIKVYVPEEDKTIDVASINPDAYVKFSKYEKLDVTDKSIDAGITVANAFVSNVTYPAHFVKGAIKNESGNSLKSGAQETFDSSVLSYATVGEPLVLKSGDLATLTYYTKDVGNKNSSDNTNKEKNK